MSAAVTAVCHIEHTDIGAFSLSQTALDRSRLVIRRFLPCNAMLARYVLSLCVCLFVRPSVCLSQAGTASCAVTKVCSCSEPGNVNYYIDNDGQGRDLC